MSAKPDLSEIVDTLAAEQLLGDTDRAAAEDYLQRQTPPQPWYIRAMVGVGAWIASLLLIGFIGSLAFTVDGAYTVVGLLFVVAATVVRWKNDNDFLVQSSLAVSLAGQALFAWGFMQMTGVREIEFLFMLVIVVSGVLFVVFPDRIHRVIMVLIAGASLTGLLYAWDAKYLVPVLGPLLAGGLVAVHFGQAEVVASGRGAFLRPLMSGLMLGAFGVLLLSTLYVLPETGWNLDIYPRPWISTLLLGALLMFLCLRVWTDIIGHDSRAVGSAAAVVIVVAAGSWAAPGLLLALIVVLLGTASGQRSMIGAGIGFLAVFLTAYFYGIQVTMLTKSMTLVATGIGVLLARWLLLTMAVPDAEADSHA